MQASRYVMRIAPLLVGAVFLLYGPAPAAQAPPAEKDPARSHTERTGKAFSPGDLFAFVPPLQKGPDDKKWFFTFGGMYVRKTGNSDTVMANMKTELKYYDNITEVILQYENFYGRVNDAVIEKKQSGTLRADHYFFQRMEVFLFTKSEKNEVTRLVHRNNSGAGLKFVLIRNPFIHTDISGAPIYQYELVKEQDRRQQWRWSLRYKLSVEPAAFLSAGYTFFYIPKVGDGSVYRYTHDAWLSLHVHDNLMLKVGYQFEYNANPPEGIGRRDGNTYAQALVRL